MGNTAKNTAKNQLSKVKSSDLHGPELDGRKVASPDLDGSGPLNAQEIDLKEYAKGRLFRDIDDVVSFGALMRPLIESAFADVSKKHFERLRQDLLMIEKTLAVPHRSYRHRIEQALQFFSKTYAYSPKFRFIEQRLRDFAQKTEESNLNDFSTVALVIGAMVEFSQKEFNS